MIKMFNFIKYFISLLIEPRSKFSEEEQRQRAQDAYLYGAVIVAITMVCLAIYAFFVI